MILRLHLLIDESKVYCTIRELRWKSGCNCPFCSSNKIRKRGKNDRHSGCQRYQCKKCTKRFDDLTGTVFSGRHQSITVWLSYLYLLGLNVSNLQIAQELDLCASDSQRMAEQLRQAVVMRKPPVQFVKGG
jgi:transposase-like protein